MASRVKVNPLESPRRPPGTTPEARENQLINLAVSEVERQITAGTASSQILTHYLKMGSTRERLEQRRLEAENELLKAKIEQLGSMKRMEELYEGAIQAMRSYKGEDPLPADDEFE